MSTRPLVLACGALGSDLRAVLGPDAPVDVELLPANLHNRPERIVPTLRPRIAAALAVGRPVFVAYADCGTGGAIDRLLAEVPEVRRLPGAHCYELFAGAADFAALHDAAPGTFYLTDYLARHFDALVWVGLGLDARPELRDEYFRHYTRVVHLVQRPDAVDAADVAAAARAAADRLGLPLETVVTGHGGLAPVLAFAGAGA